MLVFGDLEADIFHIMLCDLEQRHFRVQRNLQRGAMPCYEISGRNISLQ